MEEKRNLKDDIGKLKTFEEDVALFQYGGKTGPWIINDEELEALRYCIRNLEALVDLIHYVAENPICEHENNM